MTIGEVAARTGLATSAIRYYERVGLLEPAERVNGRRRYQADVLVALGIMNLAKSAGFSLDEVRELFDGFSDDTSPSDRWKAMARSKLAELDDLIDRADGMRRLLREGLGCECLRLEDCAMLAAGQGT